MTRACEAVGLNRATAYRHLQPPRVTVRERRKRSHRRIADEERRQILALLDSERFIDQPPREVYATLLSEGTYVCSWRTFYRILNERGPVRERRNHREPRSYTVPRLVASAPNEVWSWDIVRHEAPPNRAVMKGHGHRPVAASRTKLRAVRSLVRGRRRKAALTKPGRVSTVR